MNYAYTVAFTKTIASYIAYITRSERVICCPSSSVIGPSNSGVTAIKRIATTVLNTDIIIVFIYQLKAKTGLWCFIYVATESEDERPDNGRQNDGNCDHQDYPDDWRHSPFFRE